MKNNPNISARAFLLALAPLTFCSSHAYAQNNAVAVSGERTPGETNTRRNDALKQKSLLEGNRFGRLGSVTLGTPATFLSAHFGKPSAICASAEAVPLGTQLPPQTVPQLNPKDVPDWAKAVVSFPDKTRVIWLYKNETNVWSYGINQKGFVQSVCVVGLANRTEGHLENPALRISLGDDYRKIIRKFGKPDQEETLPNGDFPTQKMTYNANPNVLLNKTVFTVRSRRVVRICISKP